MERSTPAADDGGPHRTGDEQALDDLPGAEELLTSGDVANLFGVDPKTVSRWSDAGKLDALRTLGGHRRYRASEVHALLDQG